MRKYLLPETGNFYKANLHSHSTLSDGKQTPEEMKESYKALGYSVLAYTDHEKFVDHSDLCEEGFIALNGVEVGVHQTKGTVPYIKHCHVCFIALDQGERPVFWCKPGEEEEGKIARIYAQGNINAFIKKGRELGFFVTYNHPGWSMENYNDYMNYNGMHAMEIINWTGLRGGALDHVPHVYEDMLRGGKRLFCIATDDNHREPDPTSYRNTCGAFTMIKADRLEYKAITDALLAGNFYASQAPEIYELYYEDGFVHIKTSPAHTIHMNTGRRHFGYVGADNDGYVTEASFAVSPEDIFFRLTVTDKRGKCAHTNAYFIDQIIEK